MEGHLRKLLHVGCGMGKLPDGYGAYRETRLDCDQTANPDIVASAVAMPMVGDESFEVVFASHVVEHLYAHEVGMALGEFHRVLEPGGRAEVFVPDLQAVGGRIALGELETTVYLTAMGPISPLDMLYGHRASVAKGEWAMAHKTGFTAATLKSALQRAGFEKVLVDRSGLELKAVAIKGESCPQNHKPKEPTSTHTLAQAG